MTSFYLGEPDQRSGSALNPEVVRQSTTFAAECPHTFIDILDGETRLWVHKRFLIIALTKADAIIDNGNLDIVLLYTTSNSNTAGLRFSMIYAVDNGILRKRLNDEFHRLIIEDFIIYIELGT